MSSMSISPNALTIFNLALKRSGFPIRGILGAKRILLASEIEDLGARPAGDIAHIPEDHLSVVYKEHPLIPFTGGALKRAFVRFDFQNEWNNRGYGRITTSADAPFSCAKSYFLGADFKIIAEVIDERTGKKVSDYAALFERDGKLGLWFNRDVGPVDGYDWVVVEKYLSNFQNQEWGGFPYASEIPYGFSGAATMRIDCDEAVASGKRLFELYRDHGMPFSMAIKTQQYLGAEDLQLIEAVLGAGGAVVGHSHTHAPNWGGSAQAAQWEVEESHRVLRGLNIPGISYDYVVSPFHQNPRFSIEGLREAGVKAFVGGIICNDPEYLIARAGGVPGVPGIISHSQQCMFHGETYHQAGNSIAGYKSALKQALETNTLFGFLDHPFSNYWYGWKDEEERLAAHEGFLQHLATIPSLWRANLVDALRFLEMKSKVEINSHCSSFVASLPFDTRFVGLPSVSIKFGANTYELKMGDQVVIAQ